MLSLNPSAGDGGARLPPSLRRCRVEARFLSPHLGSFREPDGRASLSPASRVGRVPRTSSGSPGRTRPTELMGRVQVRYRLFLDGRSASRLDLGRSGMRPYHAKHIVRPLCLS
ncbi:MAG: hypothetical protein FJ398_18280 [Verrucomicrobia bacterium]|nr:hypothetical protein [Verrucomicrobiota bacterium]